MIIALFWALINRRFLNINLVKLGCCLCSSMDRALRFGRRGWGFDSLQRRRVASSIWGYSSMVSRACDLWSFWSDSSTVEQCPLKALVQGSNPCRTTNLRATASSNFERSEKFGMLAVGFGFEPQCPHQI